MAKRDDLEPSLLVLGWSRAELARRLGVHRNTADLWATKGPPKYARAYLELAVRVAALVAVIRSSKK